MKNHFIMFFFKLINNSFKNVFGSDYRNLFLAFLILKFFFIFLSIKITKKVSYNHYQIDFKNIFEENVFTKNILNKNIVKYILILMNKNKDKKN